MSEKTVNKNLTWLITVISSFLVGFSILGISAMERIKNLMIYPSDNFAFPSPPEIDIALLKVIIVIVIGIVLILGLYTIFILLRLETILNKH